MEIRISFPMFIISTISDSIFSVPPTALPLAFLKINCRTEIMHKSFHLIVIFALQRFSSSSSAHTKRN